MSTHEDTFVNSFFSDIIGEAHQEKKRQQEVAAQHRREFLSLLRNGIWLTALKGDIRRLLENFNRQLIRCGYVDSIVRISEEGWGYFVLSVLGIDRYKIEVDAETCQIRFGFLVTADGADLFDSGRAVALLLTAHDGEIVPVQRMGAELKYDDLAANAVEPLFAKLSDKLKLRTI